MRRDKSVAVANWMLEHLSCGPYAEAISGDLLEGLERGCSAGWYWREAVWAIAVGAGVKARKLGEPLLFCVFWGGLYPAWAFLIIKLGLTQVAVARWTALDLPYATSLQVICEVIPAAAFLWAGLSAYFLCHKDLARSVSRMRFVCGLSGSLNVLLVLALGLAHCLIRPATGFGDAVDVAFSESHFLAFSLLLAISLFVAIQYLVAGRRAHDASFARD